MIAVTDLIQSSYLPGNYYAPDVYVQGDFEAGLIENRQGHRLLALPEAFLQSIYAGLEDEIGPAAGLVLFRCGHWWGKSFYRRFIGEMNEYYNKPIADMEMVELLQCMKQCWKAHGWGKFDLNLNHFQQGFLVAKTQNSTFAKSAKQDSRPMCFAEAGILSAFFSQLTGRNLHCVQTQCESMGAECNYFVLGLPERLMPAEAGVEEKETHSAIMARLCPQQQASTDEELSSEALF
ncbi:MAG: V4R domain-containing protein [Cyanobacteria bacterium J06642_2]